MAKKQAAQDGAADEAAEQGEAIDSGLVEVHKDGESLHIHPSTLKEHHAAGWKAK